MAVARLISLATILAAFYVSGTIAAPNGRLLEGEDATVGTFPWVTSVRVDNVHIAVGNIISARHILTSAHGLSDVGSTPISLSHVTVRVGSINQFSGGQLCNVKSIVIQPSFGNFLHDIAIITLADPLTFTEKIAAIAVDTSDAILAEGTNVTLAGWGLRLSGASPYKLQYTTMKVLSSQECEYEAGYGYDSALCLEHDVNQGISRGDEGAGVVANNVLVGVASFFFGAGGTKFPDVSNRVSYYSEWIKNNIDPSKTFL